MFQVATTYKYDGFPDIFLNWDYFGVYFSLPMLPNILIADAFWPCRLTAAIQGGANKLKPIVIIFWITL